MTLLLVVAVVVGGPTAGFGVVYGAFALLARPWKGRGE
jgi:hypothetical protein